MQPKCVGRLVKNERDDFILINPEGRRFVVDPTLGILWKLCTGSRHIDDITSRYKSLLGLSVPDELVKNNLLAALTQLRGNGLVD